MRNSIVGVIAHQTVVIRPKKSLFVLRSHKEFRTSKGSLRPETVIALRLAQCPLTDQKAAIWIPLLKPPVLTFFAWTGCLAAEERNRLVRI
jgi:hypothetical protein